MTRPLRIAYLCDISPEDRNLYSGGNARIYDALRAHAGEVTILSNSWHMAEPMRRLMHRLPEAINLRARWRLHLALGRIIAAGVRRELKRGQYDVLFGAYAFQSMYRVRPPYPMVTAFTSDATPTIYKRSEVGQSFGNFFAPARLIDPLILGAERRVFRGLDLALWPGEWQKSGADELFGLTDATSKVVPWGANIDDPGPPAAPPAIGPGEPVEILFVGRNWWAKGGPLVAGTIEALRESGVDARLTVVGCIPPIDPAPWLTVHPQLDKAVPDDLATFRALFARAHFMHMASFESWGFAFCEAAAYGLPVLCLRTGGVPVEDGVNGHALPSGSTAQEFSGLVRGYLDEPSAYADLRASARVRYETALNWDAWGKQVTTLLWDKLREKGLS
jgi:glycosyltransferase involved in cell wall biosynthesis